MNINWQSDFAKEVRAMGNRTLFEALLDSAAETAEFVSTDDQAALKYEILYNEVCSRLKNWLGDAGQESWAGSPPQEVTVPMYARRSDRDKYYERCNACAAILTQDKDECPDCSHPVRWINSHLADQREKQRKRQQADMRAKSARGERLSELTDHVLAVARATSLGSPFCSYAPGEEAALYNYERAYGDGIILKTVEDFKLSGVRGRGIIVATLRFLEQYNPIVAKGTKHNPLTDVIG